MTEHWAEFPLHFSQLQVLSCCTLNSIEKILRSSRSTLYIKHYEIQSYLYELIHVFQHTALRSLHYQNIQWYCCVFSVNTLTCTVWIFPCIPFFLYCEVPLRRHLWLCCNISNVISLHVSHDYVLRITWQKKNSKRRSSNPQVVQALFPFKARGGKTHTIQVQNFSSFI